MWNGTLRLPTIALNSSLVCSDWKKSSKNHKASVGLAAAQQLYLLKSLEVFFLLLDSCEIFHDNYSRLISHCNRISSDQTHSSRSQGLGSEWQHRAWALTVNPSICKHTQFTPCSPSLSFWPWSSAEHMRMCCVIKAGLKLIGIRIHSKVEHEDLWRRCI